MSSPITRAALGFSFAGLVTIACSHSMETDADMNRELDRVFEQAGNMDRELDTHSSAVSAATTVGAVESINANHRAAMVPPMDDLDHMLADMTMYCRHGDSDESGRTDDMQAAMKSMRDELERHRMALPSDLPGARAEAERHVRDSRGILTRLRESGSAMRHEAGFYRCRHGNH